MPLVQGKCPNCGGMFAVDSAKDAAVCPFCDTPFIIEKAINNYHITNNINVGAGAVVNVTGNANSGFEIVAGVLKKYVGESTEVVIPDTVTSIGGSAFSGCTGLTSVTIPDSVTSIGDSAFSGCTDLTSVTIPSRVTSIGKYAFSHCTGLTSVTIGSGVTSIGALAFSNCTGLTSVTIGNSVTSIGNEAFSGCTGLTSVMISNSVTSIGYKAFYGCNGLTSVMIPDSVTSIGSSAFYMVANVVYHGSASGSPWGAKHFNSFFEAPFLYADLEKTSLLACSPSCHGEITIPDSVTSIGDDAFYGCNGLTSVTIPNSVMSIGEHAFSNCTGLTSITIPNSVMSIGNCAFSGCTGLTSVTIPNSVTTIGSAAFYGCCNIATVIKPQHIEIEHFRETKWYGENNESEPQGKSGCYVATAVYGSYDCPEVWTLRRFRDNALALTWYGRLFIALYYAISPTLVKWFGHTSWFNKMWRGRLDRMVSALRAKGYDDTPYQDKAEK